MRNIFKDKFSDTKKLVRRVLSKPSVTLNESMSETVAIEDPMDQQELLKNELEALREQISNLKIAIQTLQNDTEEKDVSIANLAREKEKITIDLLKTRRSNVTLAKQLEEERKFYFKEKEIYCHEMNECRKLKKLLSTSTVAQNEKTIEEYRQEILKLKQTLNQTLEANYNLSIKYLRMKNTKTCLKTELQTMKLEHEKLVNDYKTKIENLTIELNDLVNEKLNASISPSSKKYLQLVKQNGCLVYENLCLQLEVDNLNFKLEKLKLHQSKSTSNEQLRYIHHRTPNRQRVSETPEKLEREHEPCCSRSREESNKVVKIFERTETTDSPKIQIISEKKGKTKKSQKKKKEEVVEKQHKSTNTRNEKCDMPDYRIAIDDSYKQKISDNSSKIALFQVSNVTSTTSTIITTTLKRIRSSPDILQSVDVIKTP